MTDSATKKYLSRTIYLPLVLAAAIAFVKYWPEPEIKEKQGRIEPLGEQDNRQQFWEAYRQATKLRLAGRTQEAIADYQRAIALRDDHENALYYLGNMYVDLGYFTMAESTWIRLGEINPFSSRAHSQLGKLYLTADGLFDLDAAENEFQRSLELNKDETGPYLNLGQVALVRGNLSEAQDYFEIVIASNFRSVESYYLTGYIEWKRGNVQNALTLLGKAVEYSRPRGPGQDVSEEGDTQSGRPLGPQHGLDPMGLFRTFLTELSPMDISALPGQITGQYESLDAFLQGLND